MNKRVLCSYLSWMSCVEASYELKKTRLTLLRVIRVEISHLPAEMRLPQQRRGLACAPAVLGTFRVDEKAGRSVYSLFRSQFSASTRETTHTERILSI
jgi:hypothetical protein